MDNYIDEQTKHVHMGTIATVAKRMFIEKGFDGTTTDDIAKQAHYSKRTMYMYFRSKLDIFCYIQLLCLYNIKKELKAIGCRDLKTFLEVFERHSTENPMDNYFLKKIDLSPQVESAFSTDIKKEVIGLISSLALMLQGKHPVNVGQINAATLVFEGVLSCIKNDISCLEYYLFLSNPVG